MKISRLNELETTWAGKTCLCFEILDSTNEYARELAKKEAVHGTLVVADTQTAGKGRRGRVWQSPKGTTISMSLCLEPKIPTQNISGLTLAAALAMANAVEEAAGAKVQIKWPNDLVFNGRKICGILTELCFVRETYAVIVGIGLNVNTEDFPEEIRDMATSLKRECGREFSNDALIVAFLKHFEETYEKYEQTKDLTLLKEQYESLLVNKDCVVRVLDPKAPYTGVAKGITREGNLVVICEDGTEKEVYSGEVSVRGLYGYTD